MTVISQFRFHPWLPIGTGVISALDPAEGGTFLSPGYSTAPGDECLDIREVLNRVGDKWSLLVVGALDGGPRRFNDLRRNIHGVSQRMLTLTLRLLERDGLVARTVFATVPPSVEYELTPLGRTLIEPVRALSQWARQHRHEIRAARAQFDGQAEGAPISAAQTAGSVVDA